jgi:glycosyltransferase involved in cell wall biosynthesis
MILFLFWVARLILLFLERLRSKRLKDGFPLSLPPGEGAPRLAVIIPALNEEGEIREALVSLAKQDYPGLLLFPVNDRSDDRTGEIMEEVARERPIVRPIHVDHLPEGWLGKNHANWLGSDAAMKAGAEWLLFTDGDVQYSPGALRKAMSCAEENGFDHLAVFPELVRGGFWESVFYAAFAVWFSTRYQTWNIENPRSRQFIGIGAFNLVRASAYRAIGTHEGLALTVADDLALGKLLKRAGFRLGYRDGTGEVKVRWQPNLRSAVRGIYKNSFASMNFNVPVVAFSAASVLLLNIYPFFALFHAIGWRRVACGLALAALLAVYYLSARRLGASRREAAGIAVCSWFGGALMAWAMVASAWITLRNGGVNWRGTFYPISTLKGKQVRL